MSIFEGFVFAGTDWNDHTNFIMQDFDPGIAPKRWQWISGADSDGALAVEEAHYDNAEMTVRLRIAPQANMDAALAKIGTLVQALQEAEQQPLGSPALWTPAASTKSLTTYVVGGEVTGIPLTMSGDDAGWFLRNPAPVINIKLYRRPFLYGAEVQNAATVTNSLPSQMLTIGPWTPATIAGLELWLDPAQISGVSVDGTAVSSWTDLSGNGHHFTQGTGVNQPLYKTGIVNTKPVVRFDGVNDSLAATSWTADTSRTFFIVTKHSAATSDATLIGFLDNNGKLTDTGGAFTYTANQAGGAVSLGGTPQSGFSVVTLRVNSAASLDAYINGGAATNFDPNDEITTTTTFAIGGASGSGVFWNGDVAYVLAYNTALSNTDVDTVRNFLGATFNLGFGSIPSGGVAGDVPAEGRLVVTDGATQSRRHLEWGLQWRYYDGTTSLLLDSDSLVVSGFAGTQTTLAGAYDPNASGNSVITATLRSPVQAVCGTGNLSHIGQFRVKARCNVSSTSTRVRFSWQDGDGVFRSNNYAVPPVTGWTELDLGVITLSETTLGTQKWSGRVEGYTSGTAFGGTPATDTLYVDYLVFIPTGEGYGKARATYSYSAGVQNARDEFSGIAAATVLNARVAPAGGTWATSGATTDFTAADAPTGSDETETRATTADAAGGRFAILGATNYTDTEVQVGIYRTSFPLSGTFYQGLIARWTDASNHLRIVAPNAFFAGPLKVTKVVAGVATDLASVNYSMDLSTWYQLRAVVFASGAGMAFLLDQSGNLLTSVAFQDVVLATGGTLATGKPGFVDNNGSASGITRYYDNFSHSTPAAEPIAVYSGRSAEIRSDSAIRQDSTGVYYGPVPSYRGARFYLPASGSANRTSRLLVKLRRNDTDVGADDQIADSTTVAVHYVPRFLVAPR